MERLVTRHNSMRGWFAYELHKHMRQDPSIWVVSGDLGYGMLDSIRQDYPDRFLNVGAAEQAMMGIAVGLAIEGKKPFVYSITPFLLYRPFETIRNYVDYEKYPVRLVGGGRDRDYTHDGWSHHSPDAKAILDLWPNIKQYWPQEKEDVIDMVVDMIQSDKPSFISLRR